MADALLIFHGATTTHYMATFLQILKIIGCCVCYSSKYVVPTLLLLYVAGASDASKLDRVQLAQLLKLVL
jgi:hypothetical protein